MSNIINQLDAADCCINLTEARGVIRRLERQLIWYERLIETIRDKADLRYCGERGLLAFQKLKEEAGRNI